MDLHQENELFKSEVSQLQTKVGNLTQKLLQVHENANALIKLMLKTMFGSSQINHYLVFLPNVCSYSLSLDPM